VPNLQKELASDSHKPAGKYNVLGDVLDWATNVGYPGYANAAIDEIFNTWVINTMFAKAATGVMSPQDAVSEAHKKCEQIFMKWRNKKLV
jgi:multiple sugar transport system substrate-binding protein